jgi:peptidyl-dipeptidase Dcp
MRIPLLEVSLLMLATFAVSTAQAANPLLANWRGAYGGYPAFDRYRVSDFTAAMDTAMAAKLVDVDRIAQNPAAPTFDNTIAALERAGATYERVNGIYSMWKNTMSTPEFQAVQNAIEPRLAACKDKINQNAKLFARIKAIYDSPAKQRLSPEQQRLVWFYYNKLTRAGASLDAVAKARVAAINERLASLFATFSQNLLADENDYVLYLQSAADLAGLGESQRSSAALAAEVRGHKGEWAIVNTRSSVEPFLTNSARRDLREKVWRIYYSRGDNGGAHDNKELIAQILALRAERAKLLGYPTHAHWRVADGMAKTPERAMELMLQVWPAAVARVHQEVADMQAIAATGSKGLKIEPWDYRFYAEKVRKARYDFDLDAVKPYLQLDKLREGMFWAAGKLYGLQFRLLPGLPVVNPDVRVWEVKDANRHHVGLWYFDPYARAGKDSGAWMNEYRTQQRLAGNIAPIVSNNTNFVKGKAGEPVLISWNDAVTLFHEFGHALHGLLSTVTYRSLAGTEVARDFVEFPSQMNENWLTTPEVLSRFALHYQTGQPMPRELLAKIAASKTFNQGFQTVEYLASALVDMKLHLAGDRPIDPDAFERDTLQELNMPAQVVMRHRTPQFRHIFESDEYSAGYYSYLWAEVLDHDAFEAFEERGNPYDPALAKRLRDMVFSVGNSVAPEVAYRNFRGRDPKIDALLRARGFAVAKPQ